MQTFFALGIDAIHNYYFGALNGYVNVWQSKPTIVVGGKNENCSANGPFERGYKDSGNYWPAHVVKEGNKRFTCGFECVASFEIQDGELELTDATPIDNGNDKYINPYIKFTGGTLICAPIVTDTTTSFFDPSKYIKESTKAISIDIDYEGEVVWSEALAASNEGGLVKKGTSTLVLEKSPLFTGTVTVKEGAVLLPVGVTATPGENTAIQVLADGSKKLVPCTDAQATIDGVSYATVADALNAATTGKTVTLVDGAKLASAVTLTDKGTVTLSASLGLDADLTLANTTLVIKGLTGTGKLVLDDSAIVKSSTDLTIETPVEVTASDDKMAKIQGADSVGYTFKGSFTGAGYVQFTSTRGSFKFQNDMRDFEGTIDIPGDGYQRTVVNLSEHAYSEKAIWNIKNYDKDGSEEKDSNANLFVAGDKKTFYFGALNGNVRHNGNQSNNKLNTVVIGNKADSVLTGSFFNHKGYQSLVKDRGATIRKVGADTTLTYSGSSVRAYEVEEGTLKLTTDTAVKVSWTDETLGAQAYYTPITIKSTEAKLVVTSDVTETPNVISGVTGYVVTSSIDAVTGDTTYMIMNADATITKNGATTGYATFAAAVEAAEAGDTITAVKNVTTTETVDKNCTLNIPAGVTVNEITKANGATVTIDGAGTYSITRDASTIPSLNVTLADSWTGIVAINGGIFKKTDLNTFAKGANSTIKLNGTTGWLTDPANGVQTIAANIIIGENGWTIKDGFTANTQDPLVQFIVAGKVSGTGNFNITASQGGRVSPMAYKFTGDVSGWTGSVTSTSTGRAKYVIFEGNPETNGEVALNMNFSKTNNGELDVSIINTNPVTLNGTFTKGTAATSKLNLILDAVVTAAKTPTLTGLELDGTGDTLTVPTALAAGTLLETDLDGEGVKGVTLDDGEVLYKVTDADVFFKSAADADGHPYVSLFVNTDTTHPFTEAVELTYLADYDCEVGRDVTFTVVMDSEYYSESMGTLKLDTTSGTVTQGDNGIWTLTGWTTNETQRTVTITASLNKPDFPFNEGEADETVKAKYAAWAETYKSHTSADGNAFLLNVAPTEETNLTVTAISISGTTVTIDTSHALENANGIVYVLSGTDLAHVTAITSDTTITKIEKTTIAEGGVITLTGKSGATAEFYKVGVGYTLPVAPTEE